MAWPNPSCLTLSHMLLEMFFGYLLILDVSAFSNSVFHENGKLFGLLDM